MNLGDLEKLADQYVITITANTPELRAATKFQKWGVSLGNPGGSFYTWADTLPDAVEKALAKCRA